MKPDVIAGPVRQPAPRTERKDFTKKQRAECFWRASGRCEVCAVKLMGRYDIDHIIALDHGGKHEPGNWRVLCVACHKAKTADDAGISAHINRLHEKHGFKEPKRKPGPKLRGAGFSNRNRKFDGTVGPTQAAARTSRSN